MSALVEARAAVLAALDHARAVRTYEACDALRQARVDARKVMRSVPYGTEHRTDLARALGQALSFLESCGVSL